MYFLATRGVEFFTTVVNGECRSRERYRFVYADDRVNRQIQYVDRVDLVGCADKYGVVIQTGSVVSLVGLPPCEEYIVFTDCFAFRTGLDTRYFLLVVYIQTIDYIATQGTLLFVLINAFRADALSMPVQDLARGD